MRKVISVFFILVSFEAQSAVYKCVDTAGKVSFSDRPCQGDQVVEKNITTISDEAASFYEVSPESKVEITQEIHALLDLKHRGRRAIDICLRSYGDYRMTSAFNAWEDKNKEKLDKATTLLNSGDSMAYQLNLVTMMNKYKEEFKRLSKSDRIKKCDSLIIELESDQTVAR